MEGVMGEKVEFKSDGNLATGYQARPAQPGPGLIVIQDWWGLAFFRRELKS